MIRRFLRFRRGTANPPRSDGSVPPSPHEAPDTGVTPVPRAPMQLGLRGRARLEFAAKAFLVASFLGTATAGVLRLEARALADERHVADLGAWSVVERPDWLTLDDVRSLRDSSRLDGWCASSLDPGTGPVVARALEATPLVSRVAAIRRVPPNAFDVVVEVRRPVAAVRCGAPGDAGPHRAAHRAANRATDRARNPAAAPFWVEVDARGRALGAATHERPARDGRPLREVVGAAVRSPRPGDRLGDDVADAAALSEELDLASTPADRELFATVAEIDVSNHRGRATPGASEIVLRLGAGPAGRDAGKRCEIEWGRGRSDGPDDPEPSFGARAAHLAAALRTFPGLAGLRTVRVAFEDLVVVPLAGSPLTGK